MDGRQYQLIFFNSVWITVVSVVFTVLFASLVTFAITRMRWKGRSLVLGLFMVGLMIPVHSTLIPLFSLFLKLNLTDHPLSVILSYIAFNMPITIMILLGFYYALPREVEEANGDGWMLGEPHLLPYRVADDSIRYCDNGDH